MINTNIKNSHTRIENLYKSIFAQMHDISIAMHDQHIEIRHHDESNIDAAVVEIIEGDLSYTIRYWDGYSLAEVIEEHDLNKALKVFKNFSKKMARNIQKFK